MAHIYYNTAICQLTWDASWHLALTQQGPKGCQLGH